MKWLQYKLFNSIVLFFEIFQYTHLLRIVITGLVHMYLYIL